MVDNVRRMESGDESVKNAEMCLKPKHNMILAIDSRKKEKR